MRGGIGGFVIGVMSQYYITRVGKRGKVQSRERGEKGEKGKRKKGKKGREKEIP